MILVLTGKSAAGKSTMEKFLTDNLRYERVVSTTTRPMRSGEVDGFDYHFVSKDKFIEMKENGEFLETTEYNNWFYGITKDEIENKKNVVLVIDAYGFRNLKNMNVPFISFYIDTTDSNRYIRQISRGDNILEVAMRSERDKATFQGIRDEVDFIVDNNGEDYFYCVLEILERIYKVSLPNE